MLSQVTLILKWAQGHGADNTKVMGSIPAPPLELSLRVLSELTVQLPGPHPLPTPHKLLWVIPKKWCCDFLSLSISHAKSINFLLLLLFFSSNSAAVLWRNTTFHHNILKICTYVTVHSKSVLLEYYFLPRKDTSHFGISQSLTTIISTCFTTPLECYPQQGEKILPLFTEQKGGEDTGRWYNSLLLSQLRW